MKYKTMQIVLAMVLGLFFMSCQKSLDQQLNRDPELKATSTSLPGICDYIQTESALTSAGWTKIFEDNFDTDLSKWNIWTGGAFNEELQYYQPGNIQVSNSTLLITAKKETVTGRTNPWDNTQKTFAFTSGRIESKTNVSASQKSPKIRMVARIKLPAGYGMWPAFWSYGDPWPTQGEIDILESRGNEPFNYSTNYFFGRRANVNLVSNAEGHITSASSLQECWHVYEVIWSKDALTFMLDGVVVKTNTGGYVPNMFGKTQRITLNVAVGGVYFWQLNPSLIQTGTLQVDWVKVFQSK